MLNQLFIFIIFIGSVFSQTPIQFYENYTNHECKRECNGKPMRCYYKLIFEFMFSLEPNCLDCLNGNVNDCDNPQCIRVDGRRRLVMTYNRMIPGPSIEVCEGDEIMVDLQNGMMDVEASIHWHGIHQRGTQWMDGVPQITQCPVTSGTTFRYHFRAKEAGTHFYHSHIGVQMGDGAYGPLIVRQPKNKDPHKSLYDFDLSENVIIVSDWYWNISNWHFYDDLRNRRFDWEMISAVLINGVASTDQNNVPPKRFEVETGRRYRFRVIHAGGEPCPLNLTIQNHQMEVIASDGFDFKPYTVDTITLLNGERYDFILHANQSPGMYVMRLDGDILCANKQSYALVGYKGFTGNQEVTYGSVQFSNATISNCVNAPSTNYCYNFDNMTSLRKIEARLRGPPGFKYFIEMDIYDYARYGVAGVTDDVVTTPLLNRIAFTFPSTPLLIEPTASRDQYCNENLRPSRLCNGSICECVHLISVPLHTTVELIFVDDGAVNITHPMHLHGNSFRVLGEEKLGANITLDFVKDLDRRGRLKRNFENPPIKDTVNVPSGGYTIVRFIADNPGFWALHCHVDFHASEGMFMVLKTGTGPNVPRSFPRCGDYLHTNRV